MFYIVMGVSGSGKTTIGRLLAERLGCPFFDGDDYHPPENVTKMAAGRPLDDEDRAGWLAALAAVIRSGLAAGGGGVIACSALKEKYRSALRVQAGEVMFIYLKGSYELILARLQSRRGHYMRAGLLQSQFDTLDEPLDALVVDVGLPPAQIVQTIIQHIT